MANWLIDADSDALLLTREGVTIRVRLFGDAAGLIHRLILDSKIGPAKIASRGFPTQAQINEMIAAWRLRHPETEQIDIEDLL